MKLNILILLYCLTLFYQTEAGVFRKIAEKMGLTNLINVEAEGHGQIGQNKIDVEGDMAVASYGVGAYGSANADVLGQKGRVKADVLDGEKVYEHNHQVQYDSNNRPFIWEKKYVDSRSVLVKKYLDKQDEYIPRNKNEEDDTKTTTEIYEDLAKKVSDLGKKYSEKINSTTHQIQNVVREKFDNVADNIPKFGYKSVELDGERGDNVDKNEVLQSEEKN